MLQRMLGAARLDVHTYEEVEADSGALLQALGVVIIVSIAGIIGAVIGGLDQEINLVGAIIFGIIAGLVQWALWALITLLIGTTIFKTPQTHANWGQLARTTGFAQSPGVLNVLVFIPFIGQIIVLVATIWRLVAMVVAVRQALDYESTWRAVGVVVVGFIVVIVPLLILNFIFGAAG